MITRKKKKNVVISLKNEADNCNNKYHTMNQSKIACFWPLQLIHRSGRFVKRHLIAKNVLT